MCDESGWLPGPGELIGSLGSLVSAIPLRYVAGGVAVLGAAGFAVAHAAVIGALAVVFLAVMGAIVWAMRRAVLAQGRARAATLAPVTVRRGQGVRALTTGQRAIEGPRVVLPGLVLDEAERAAR